ncbi:ATP-binding protein [Roseisolibacter sp. H3M3-2]|uniref:PAS domain-containing sensor histidine kinase n=1 Tax=Roseisolibacter sp. H3M3-2 TaxID=3031323 RepID=UPI0023DBDD17|nr:ATP-binding protein [Roseisolibacter sp. H3M3-2]MDF1504486.1 ATP-binding protein [Roseisolibacter sp. H3M3-2]
MTTHGSPGAPPTTTRAVAADGAAPDWLLESLGEGLLVLDPAWRLVYLNAAAERMTGVEREDALGSPIWETFPALVGSPVEEAWRETMTARAPVALQTVPLPRRPGGRTAAVFDARIYPVDDAAAVGGGGILVLFTEVGDRERRRRDLAERSEENERLRALARGMAAEADSGRLLEALCSAARVLCEADGATVAEIGETEGKFVASLGHPPSVLGHAFPLAGTLTGRLLAEFRATGQASLLRATDAEARDPAYCGELESGGAVGALLLAPLAAHGDLLGVLAISRAEGRAPFGERDAQRLQVVADHASLALWKARLVADAQAATRTASTFLATVSHELRTPLTALTGYGELLADEILGPLSVDQHDVVERMRGVTHQLTAMIEEILTFSSLEAGKELVRPVAVDVADVVQTVATVVEPLARQKGLDFVLEVPPLPPPLVTDPDKTRQILINLCGNAVKFTARGTVALRVTAAEGTVRFAVSDTGVGIRPEDLPKLFRPFTQLDAGLTRRYGGTGLGLYISQRLAGLLGGRIAVRSAAGEGSEFALILPAAGVATAGVDGTGVVTA